MGMEGRIKNLNELSSNGDRYRMWSNYCTLCGFVYVFVSTVHLCKQAACYFLAPVPLETLEALWEAPLHHLEVVSKRKGRMVNSVCNRGIFLPPSPRFKYTCWSTIIWMCMPVRQKRWLSAEFLCLPIPRSRLILPDWPVRHLRRQLNGRVLAAVTTI